MKRSMKYVAMVALLAGAALLVVVPRSSAQDDKPTPGESAPAAKPGEDELLLLLKQLQEEVQSLRREVAELREQRSRRDGDAPREGAPRDGAPRDAGREEGPRNPERRAGGLRPGQAERIFKAYDKNSDGKASFEEWLAMREGEITPERRVVEQMRFSAADTEHDGGLTFAEFAFYLENRGRIPEGALRGTVIGFDETQYTLLVNLVGRSGEGGQASPDGEKTFNVVRDVKIVLEDGTAGKIGDLSEGAAVQLWLTIDGKQVIGVQRLRK